MEGDTLKKSVSVEEGAGFMVQEKCKAVRQSSHAERRGTDLSFLLEPKCNEVFAEYQAEQ